jgi:hypothetical protein
LALGAHIKAQSHGFWIDLVEFNTKRLRRAHGTDPSIPDLALICAVGVVRSALLGDRLSVECQLKEMRAEFIDMRFRNAFGAIKGNFISWQLERELPATPHMTTEELATALTLDELDGFSRASVFRILREDDGRLRTEEPHDDGPCHWVRFRHIQPVAHIKILHAVREFFRREPRPPNSNRPALSRIYPICPSEI